MILVNGGTLLAGGLAALTNDSTLAVSGASFVDAGGRFTNAITVAVPDGSIHLGAPR